jgi:Tfp pilus assembly protein PilF
MLLAGALGAEGEREALERVLRAAQGRNPGDFWLNIFLGNELGLWRPSAASRDEGIGFLRAAVASRPRAAPAHNDLGFLLAKQGRVPEAEKEFREALRLQPDFPGAHNNLGLALAGQNQPAEAEKEYREAIRLKPDAYWAHTNLGLLLAGQNKPAEAEKEYRDAIWIQPNDYTAHCGLGILLAGQNKPAEAEKEYKEAIRIKPDYPEAHCNLGYLLAGQNKPAEAEKEYKEALRHKPDYPEAHYSLGAVLEGQGKPAEAEREYREAIRLKPDDAGAHCNLGHFLRNQGRLREALDELRRGRELGARDPNWRYLGPSGQWVKECERLVELDALLPCVLAGAAEPADASAAQGFVRVCQLTKRHAAAARLTATVMDSVPGVANDPRSVFRYKAACSAALAGCGQGIDAPADEGERARLRAQALAWLRADLAWWAKPIESGDPNARAVVKGMLSHWKKDPALAGVRDADALRKLPEAERDAWCKLWADVGDLLAKAEAK